MPTRLFHRTTAEGLAAIPVEGFRDGEDGGVWLSAHMDDWGAQGSRLLEVVLDLEAADLTPYAIEVVADEIGLDDDDEIFVTCGEEEVERFTWYKIPAATLNALGNARPMSPEEVRRFLLGDED